jgi:alkaline phosphatase D
MAMSREIDRRAFLQAALVTGGGTVLGCVQGGAATAEAPSTITGPAIVPSDPLRPRITHGVQSGDVTASEGIVWARADRLSRMEVEWDTDPRFPSPRRVPGPMATEGSDFTARVDLQGLPPGQRIHYRVVFEPPSSPRAKSEPVAGSFTTAPVVRSDVTVAWSGDTAGQGWGINLEWGGMKTYEAVRNKRPDLFIHCGDLIYADNPIPPEITLPDGRVWKNVTTDEKSRVAETLADFRGNFAYNLLDQNVRRLAAEVASVAIWDDHEVHDNWYPGLVLKDPRYAGEPRCGVLAERARQAMFEYTPLRSAPADPKRLYRKVSRGPLLDVFLVDGRSYRNDNGENKEPVEAAFLGREQIAWLEGALASSKAVWKVIASNQPLSLVVARGKKRHLQHDAWANKDAGPPRGRELELYGLLRFIKRQRVRNVIFVTADVHYSAAIRYEPSRATVSDFDPFWEFVSGPLHASTYGPNPVDPTFGPEVVYQSPRSGKNLRSPMDGGQYFGTMKIDGKSSVMRVSLWDLHGKELHAMDLPPVP